MSLVTAKVFSTGNSQAVRLPRAFRVDVQEMWIARNEVTGVITLKPKESPDALKAFLSELKAAPRNSGEFIPERDDAVRPDPFSA